MRVRGGWRLLAVGLVWGAMVCPGMQAARPKLPVPSTWELDQLRSDFGGGPKMQLERFTVDNDKPAMLSMNFEMTDDTGQTVKSTWSGPQNGEVIPLTGDPGVSFGMDKDGEEHWVFADGTTRVGKLMLSKHQQTVMVRAVVTTKDGKQYNQVLMYNRTE